MNPNQPSAASSTSASAERERREFFVRFGEALSRHVNGVGRSRLAEAKALGVRAERAGYTVTEVANAYGRGLAAEADMRAGGDFLSEVLRPLEGAERKRAREGVALRGEHARLREKAVQLAEGNRGLAREVARRKAGEVVIQRARLRYRALFLESQIMQKKLRRLARQVISAQEDERRQISRELHDEVVQTLVGINVRLATLGKGATAGLSELKARIAQTRKLVAYSVKTVHRFARDLRPAVLDDLGLVPALRAYGSNLATRKRLKIEFVSCPAVEGLDADKRTVLFRVAQEALTNVARHARAGAIEVRFSETPDWLRMDIHDDGRSFAVDKVLDAANPRRLGLVGMRERMEMIGGRLRIKSAPGEGTTVTAEVKRAKGGGA